jgi:membrane associated rhomboid family serine protease
MIPLADTAKQKRPAVVTGLLIAANFAVFGWELWLGFGVSDHALSSFVTEHALVAKRIIAHPTDGPQWLTLLSHMFLHGGPMHVLGNMWFLWIFGSHVEDRMGSLKYLLFYLLSGFAAAVAQIVVAPGATIPMVGASGAISGVLGAYLFLFPTAWILTLVPWIVPILPLPALVFLPYWFVIQALSGLGALKEGVDGGVAWWAHAGGFLAGASLTWWAKREKWIRKKA